MISKLNIRNFKIHRDTRLEIGGLTVLTGLNSSGKSSILQTLLLLRQSFLKNRLSEGLELNGELCNPGNGQDILYRQADTGKMSFEIHDEKERNLRFDFDTKDCLNDSFISREKTDFDLSSLASIALFGNNFQYISSLRGGGSSHYERCNYEVEKTHQISCSLGRGEGVAHFLYKFGGDLTTNYLDENFGQRIELSEQVQGWEKVFSPGLEIRVQKGTTDGFDVLYGYKVEGIPTRVDLRAENIGYGISHSLPVVVALTSAQPGSLILLENPEAHLHPLGQSKLATLICRAAQNGVQVIVETHSDHILSGIQLAAVRHEKKVPGGIDRNKVRLYYFQKDRDTQSFSWPIKVGLTATGRLENQPEGFFDQEENVFNETQKILNNDN